MAATLEQRAATLGADLVLEGGGVKGIGLVGAVLQLVDAGYTFPRVAGTSAGAIVAALIAGYQTAGVPLTQLRTDLAELDYTRFEDKTWAESHLGAIGLAESLVVNQGLYRTDYLAEWLHSKLDPIDIHTFADLRIDDDDHSSLAPTQRYRLVTHTSDLTRQVLVRLPWDLPHYLVHKETPPLDASLACIDAYSVVEAVRASMSLPFFFWPFRQTSTEGTCTWVDGGVLSNFPITVFDRTDALPGRWPTFGIKLAKKAPSLPADYAVTGDIHELIAIAHTLLAQWDAYQLDDEGVANRTIWVDTLGVATTDFHLDPATSQRLFESGSTAATAFLATWVARTASAKGGLT